MSEPARIGLRLVGVLLLVLGIAAVVVLFVPGPTEVAGWMGENCRRSKHGSGEQCTVGDVIQLALGAPLMILVGFVLTIALRPPGKGPFTLDLSGRRGG